MSIDVPEKGDKIFIKVAGVSKGDYCIVIDWDVEHGNQSWAVLTDGTNKWQVNMSQIANYSILNKYAAPPEQYVIKRAGPPKEIKVEAASPDTLRKYKIAKSVESVPDSSSELNTIKPVESVEPVESDPDPSPELKGITDPTLRALKLAELRKQQQKLKMDEIKDRMKNPTVRTIKHNYEMPSFKKRSE